MWFGFVRTLVVSRYHTLVFICEAVDVDVLIFVLWIVISLYYSVVSRSNKYYCCKTFFCRISSDRWQDHVVLRSKDWKITLKNVFGFCLVGSNNLPRFTCSNVDHVVINRVIWLLLLQPLGMKAVSFTKQQLVQNNNINYGLLTTPFFLSTRPPVHTGQVEWMAMAVFPYGASLLNR